MLAVIISDTICISSYRVDGTRDATRIPIHREWRPPQSTSQRSKRHMTSRHAWGRDAFHLHFHATKRTPIPTHQNPHAQSWAPSNGKRSLPLFPSSASTQPSAAANPSDGAKTTQESGQWLYTIASSPSTKTLTTSTTAQHSLQHHLQKQQHRQSSPHRLSPHHHPPMHPPSPAPQKAMSTTLRLSSSTTSTSPQTSHPSTPNGHPPTRTLRRKPPNSPASASYVKTPGKL